MRHLGAFSVLVLFFVIFHLVCSENSPKDGNNFSEDELQMCIDSFAVHTEKIIRTQDSIDLGAKYITVAEVDGRQDCLKLCCKTKECDVFIFEEKKQGSCYLFHCGPPHDFRCKFTTHANYTSAVLTNLNYHNPIHREDQIKRTQQEHELKSLRNMRDRPSIEYIYTEANVPVITESPKLSVITTNPPKTGCHRNQYECRTSHDCIAIYNVCDGIPQCPDGSDEASDLACPTEKPTAAPPEQIPHLHEQILPGPEISKYPANFPHHKNFPPFYNNPEIPLKSWQSPLSMPPGLQYPPQRVMSLPPSNYGPQGYASNWDYRQMYDQSKDTYPSISGFHGKGDMEHNHYDQEQSHIFNHKRPGMIGENVEESGGSYVESERHYDPYYMRQNHENWQESQPVVGEVQPKSQPTVSSPVESKNVEDTNDVKKAGPVNHENKPPSEKTSTPKQTSNIKKELRTQKNVHPPHHSGISSPIASSSTLNNTKHTNKSVENQNKPIENHEEIRIHHYSAELLKQHNHNDNNAVLKPRGAVISLSIGVIITVIMITIITCRLRVVRKRGRRHGPFAHDADYLMNGMYL